MRTSKTELACGGESHQQQVHTQSASNLSFKAGIAAGVLSKLWPCIGIKRLGIAKTGSQQTSTHINPTQKLHEDVKGARQVLGGERGVGIVLPPINSHDKHNHAHGYCTGGGAGLLNTTSATAAAAIVQDVKLPFLYKSPSAGRVPKLLSLLPMLPRRPNNNRVALLHGHSKHSIVQPSASCSNLQYVDISVRSVNTADGIMVAQQTGCFELQSESHERTSGSILAVPAECAMPARSSLLQRAASDSGCKSICLPCMTDLAALFPAAAASVGMPLPGFGDMKGTVSTADSTGADQNSGGQRCAVEAIFDTANVDHLVQSEDRRQRSRAASLASVSSEMGPAEISIGSGALRWTNPSLPSTMQRVAWSLEDFALLRVLQQNQEGATVVQAMCCRSRQMVCLKVTDMLMIPEALYATVYREAMLLASLQHPNIVTLHAAFDDGPFVVLVMEWCANGDLSDFVRKKGGRLPEKVVAHMVMPVLCGALEYAHAQGILHRDIKPRNILITEEGVMKLADWGVAISLQEERAVTRTGTVAYMAPEVANRPLKTRPSERKSDVSYTPAIDIFSLGVLAYELIVGFPPSMDSGAAPGQRNAAGPALSGPIQFPKSVSTHCKNVILAMLSEWPGDRPSALELMDHPWMLG